MRFLAGPIALLLGIAAGGLFVWLFGWPPVMSAAAAGAAISGLIGALIGGAVTIVAQLVTAANDRKRSEQTRLHDQDTQARAENYTDVRQLLRGFTDVHRDVQLSRPTLAMHMGTQSWAPMWERIWTDEKSLDFDVLAELIRDEKARAEVRKVVKLLDALTSVTSEAFPGRTGSLRTHALNLSSHAIGVVATYLRNEQYAAVDQDHLSKLEKKLEEYDSWVNDQIQNAEWAVESDAEVLEAEAAADKRHAEAEAESDAELLEAEERQEPESPTNQLDRPRPE